MQPVAFPTVRPDGTCSNGYAPLMYETDESECSGSKLSQVLDAAVRLPGVRINRASYLRTALKRYCSAE